MRLVKTAGMPAAMAFASFFVACIHAAPTASAKSPKTVVGGSYKINGRWYHPQANPSYDQVGTASWYGVPFHGRRTANGERFDMHALTAAHPTLPLSTVVRVTNLDNGQSVAVRINDRGPFARGRIIDMSHAGARALGFDARGTARVRVTVLPDAALAGDRDGKSTEGRSQDERGAATSSARRRAPRSRDRRTASRDRGRGRPAARPSYLRRRTARSCQTASVGGCSR